MADSYAFLLARYVYPLSQRIQGRRITALLEEAESNQYLSNDALRAIQFERLGRLLVHAYTTVPFYRKSFRDHGIQPGDIRSWEDFERLPILSKDEIRRDVGKFVSSSAPNRVYEVRTGGSTGSPMRFFMDQTSTAAAHAARIRGMRWWGIELGDREVRFWGHSGSFRPGWRGTLQKKCVRPFKDLVMNRKTLSAYDMSPATMETYWGRIQLFRPKYCFGYASTLHLFSQYVRKRRYDGRSLSLCALVTCAEILYDWQRREMEDVFGCGVANEYGASEVGVIGYGCPCGAIHTMDDQLIVEVLNAAPNDEFGEVIITHLYNWGSPLIRYRIQDLATVVQDNSPCSHGVGLSQLKQVIGRQHDLIRRPDGGAIHGEFFTHIFDFVEDVENFQVIQRSLREFHITIVTRSGGSQLRAEQEDWVQSRIVEHLGNVRVFFRYARRIPREDSGKYRWVKSEIEV